MSKNVAQKLLESHLVSGRMLPGEEIGLRIDQTLCQDATGTMVMLELEAMGLDRVKTELSAQYVDHNLIQTDFKNADDHLFLRSACRKFGVWFSRPGNGVSHPVHFERFGIPGKTLLGSDSHTCSGGAQGMLAIGAGGLEVAMAMAGDLFYIKTPKIWGVKLTGKLPDWVSAKDVILEMLRRHGVSGGVGKIIEYYGPGLDHLSAMDRHVIANMGAELGATTTVFPSDNEIKRFLRAQQREDAWTEIIADPGAIYDEYEEIDLSTLEPLIALPSSPGNVVPVREVAGREIYQAMIGSSANPGLRDFAVPAMIVQGRQISDHVSLDINPSSRQMLENLVALGYLGMFIRSGGRIHQAGCNGCIGMGQAPATHKISLRTIPRNFPGRSGTKDDLVYLCSPETAAASALTGVITDPRTLDMPYPVFKEPDSLIVNAAMLIAPAKCGDDVTLEKGPNIKSLPEFDPLLDTIEGPVLLKLGDNISTDEILPSGTKSLPFRSNIQEVSKFVFSQIDETYHARAMKHKDTGSFVVAGKNYGQGSSREHAALAPRHLGLRAVLAKSFARIHWQNLTNFGVIPLEFNNSTDYDKISQDDYLVIKNIASKIQSSNELEVVNKTKNEIYLIHHSLTSRQIETILAGSLINIFKKRHQEEKHKAAV
ncbi:MAG TPA: aconitate hydratase [candidate division Zixibacteria bacterium]|nr:aconitate hydratase [candidate division Zixibacteria bacterium]